jgi:P27 family predicted phage terminase small subunit
MGKRGPRPTPKATLAARGSRKAASRPGEPEPVSGLPQKPPWLGEIASAKWDELIPALAEQGCMSATYGDFLAMYCQSHQDLHDAMKIISVEGMTCLSEKGGAYLHPAVAIKQNAIERIAKFGREFGMSAASVRDVTKTQTAKKTLANSARKR